MASAEIPVTAPRAVPDPESRLGMTIADVSEAARPRFPIEQDVDGADDRLRRPPKVPLVEEGCWG